MKNNYSNIYPDPVLQYYATRYPDNIRWNFNNLMLAKLYAPERFNAFGVRLEIPLKPHPQFSDTPFSFYADVQNKVIYAPISSVKFIDDLSVASAWLERNGYSQETLVDYLSVLKYGLNRFPAGQIPDPIKALHVPEKAWESDQWVDDVSQKLLKSIIVWILGHELGHIVFQHPSYDSVSFETSQKCEQEADAFATDMFRRIGTMPGGMILLFTLFTNFFGHRGDFTNQGDWENYLRTSTHPVSSDRLKVIANELILDPESFVGAEPDFYKSAQLTKGIGLEAKKIAEIIEAPEMQTFLTGHALAIDLSSLYPRRPGENAITESEYSEAVFSDLPFSGMYKGEHERQLKNGEKEALASTAVFYRKGNRVNGRFSFGVGVAELQGLIENDALHYNWTWGKTSGRGILKAKGSSFSGTWGYDDQTIGGGTWTGARSNQSLSHKN